MARRAEGTGMWRASPLRRLSPFWCWGCRRDGKQMYYSLADDHVKTILDAGLEHVEE